MTASIFTPTHDASGRFIRQAYESLLAQTDHDWEWVVLFNDGASPIDFADSRVKVVHESRAPRFVGYLKGRAVDYTSHDILIELDHDDLLLPTAVAKIKDAFATSDAGFVYSNTIAIDKDENSTPRFDASFGWQYRPTTRNGKQVDERVAFPATPDSVSRIWYAPDHVRAFRRSVYDAAGGYNREMRVLDDQDIMARMYVQAPFKHVDEPLYVYRDHGANAYRQHNQEIQQNVWRLYDQYIMPLACAWAKRSGLRLLDLGGGVNPTPGFETVDLEGADITADLEKPWPFADSSVGVVRAMDIFEHLRHPLHTIKELSRVLAPGGWAFIQVPSTDGRGAFQDPTHVSYWNENSFLYYINADHAKYIRTPVRFQAPRLLTTVKDAQGVCWTIAHLVNLKDGFRPVGRIDI